MVTPDHDYHANTTDAISISAYKFNAKGGIGQPDWVQLVDVADDYRGQFWSALLPKLPPVLVARSFHPKGHLTAVHMRIRAAGGA